MTLSGNQALGSSSPAAGALLTAVGGDFLNHLTAVSNSSAGTGARSRLWPAPFSSGILCCPRTRPPRRRPAPAPSHPSSATWRAPNTCNLSNNVLQDKHSTDPQLGPLAGNGSDNGTQTHELLTRNSPAVEFATAGCVRPDQRNVNQFGDECDSGAYEFDGRAVASIPDCSPTGVIPLALDEPPGGDVVGLSYKVDGGTEIQDGVSDIGDPRARRPSRFPKVAARWSTGAAGRTARRRATASPTSSSTRPSRTSM